MAARLGTTMAALLARFGVSASETKAVLVTDAPSTVDVMREFDKRTAELKADEEEHERFFAEPQMNEVAAPVAERDRCQALSDVVFGWPCRLKNDHRPSGAHDWEIGGVR